MICVYHRLILKRLHLCAYRIPTDSLVTIEGNSIVYAGPKIPFERSAEISVIDCTGKTILPGLFDAHIHPGGASTLGYIYLEDERKLHAFLYSGVTSVFDLGTPPDRIFSLRGSSLSSPCSLLPKAMGQNTACLCPRHRGGRIFHNGIGSRSCFQDGQG